MKLPNIRSTESNQMSMSRIFLQSVSLCLLFVKSSLFLKSPDYLFEESRLFVQSSGSKCTVYMCLLFVRSVSLRLKSLALLRAAIKSYSKLVLYSPKTGNIFSEKKKNVNKSFPRVSKHSLCLRAWCLLPLSVFFCCCSFSSFSQH